MERAEGTPDELYHELVARAKWAVKARPRGRPHNFKDDVVRNRRFKVLRQKREDVVEFSYRLTKRKRDYRGVALRKNLSVEPGEDVLFREYRYFFRQAPRNQNAAPPVGPRNRLGVLQTAFQHPMPASELGERLF